MLSQLRASNSANLAFGREKRNRRTFEAMSDSAAQPRQSETLTIPRCGNHARSHCSQPIPPTHRCAIRIRPDSRLNGNGVLSAGDALAGGVRLSCQECEAVTQKDYMRLLDRTIYVLPLLLIEWSGCLLKGENESRKQIGASGLRVQCVESFCTLKSASLASCLVGQYLVAATGIAGRKIGVLVDKR